MESDAFKILASCAVCSKGILCGQPMAAVLDKNEDEHFVHAHVCLEKYMSTVELFKQGVTVGVCPQCSKNIVPGEVFYLGPSSQWMEGGYFQTRFEREVQNSALIHKYCYEQLQKQR